MSDVRVGAKSRKRLLGKVDGVTQLLAVDLDADVANALLDLAANLLFLLLRCRFLPEGLELCIARKIPKAILSRADRFPEAAGLHMGLRVLDRLLEKLFPFNACLALGRKFAETKEIGFSRKLAEKLLGPGDHFGILLLAHQRFHALEFALDSGGLRVLVLFFFDEIAELGDGEILRVRGDERIEESDRFFECLRGKELPCLGEFLLLLLLAEILAGRSEQLGDLRLRRELAFEIL